MNRGYIKIWRKMLDNPHMMKPDVLYLWVYLLIKANHKERDELLGAERITCKPGQFTTGRNQIAKKTGLNRSRVERILKLLEIEQQIEQRTTNTNRLITILNWNKYQSSEQLSEHQVSNERATSEQRVSTLKELKNDKNVRKKNKGMVFKRPTIDEIKIYCEERNNGIDAEYFFNKNEACGWVLKNGQPIKDWRATIRTWESYRKKYPLAFPTKDSEAMRVVTETPTRKAPSIPRHEPRDEEAERALRDFLQK